jgi:hypothetical protein
VAAPPPARSSAGYWARIPTPNVDLVREMYERRERGDLDVTEFVHPEIEFARIGSELPDFAGGTA